METELRVHLFKFCDAQFEVFLANSTGFEEDESAFVFFDFSQTRVELVLEADGLLGTDGDRSDLRAESLDFGVFGDGEVVEILVGFSEFSEFAFQFNDCSRRVF